jgi:phosphoenolpyruvate synthase/pyruvate phosphate dikinase
MTSHAAIVSRELKVPCLVNTKGATAILRDNDRVEIISGLRDKDVIVSDKAYSLTDGMEVSE